MAKKKKKTEKPPREFTRRQLSQLQRQRRRQRITFYGGVSIIAAVILIVLIGWYIGEYRPMHQTVIAIGDTEFDADYYIDAIRYVGRNQPAEYLQSLAEAAVSEIEQNELIKQGALKLGISVSDDEAKEPLKASDVPINDASLDFVRAGILQERLINDYFGTQLPISDKQVHIMAMLLESESQALEIRSRLQNSENFTSLAEEFALNYYSKNVNKGDFGWHPESIYDVQLGSPVAIEYAFSAEPGELSRPMHDEEADKQLGYWLIRVNDILGEGSANISSANVSAVFLSSEDEAREIKEKLEAGEALGPIADEYSDYSLSREKHGELGIVVPEQASDVFDEYVFDSGVELGEWSEPFRDENYWSKGGYWLVKVIDKDDDRELSVEDRDYLLGKIYDDWISKLWVESAAEINHTYLTPELKQWVIEEAAKD